MKRKDVKVMEHMSLQEITSACKGVYHGDLAFLEKEVSGVAIDSRKIKKDFLFVPIKGARVDGHDFIPQVMEEKGALCTLSEQELIDVSFPYILVSSCEQALKDLAEHYRSSLDIKVVGITGSVGKTSTKEMIASVLCRKYNVLKTEGNFNNEIGLPLTVFRIQKEHEIAVLEMGISDFGEMHRLAKIAKPDICVITNIGPCHLEQLHDRAGVLKAKTEVFDHLAENSSVVLNGDDDMLSTVKEVKGKAPYFFGLNPGFDFYADEILDLGLEGTTCTLHSKENKINTHISIPGTHMVYNALAGAAVGTLLGLTPQEIREGIESLVPVAGRNHFIRTETFDIIDDCYNANPVSMKASLDVLSLAKGRKVAILGDMGELGSQERSLHREVGIYAAQKKVDVLVCIGSISAEYIDGANEVSRSHTKTYHFSTKEEFLSVFTDILEKGDTILVKSSHMMDFPKIVSALSGYEEK